MEYVHRETGAYGDEAKAMLRKFIDEKQGNLWKNMSADNEPESPIPTLK